MDTTTENGLKVKVTPDSVEIPQPSLVLSKDSLLLRLNLATQRRDGAQKEIDEVNDLLDVIPEA